MNREKAERNLKIGLFGAMLTLIGDCLIGAAKFPDGANLIEGYFAIALAMPAWRPILGGLLPCGAFMWIYKVVAEAAGQEIGRAIALKYLLYFLLPAAAVFGVFFIGASAVQFIAFAKGCTPFPKCYCVFNLLIGKAVFNAVRRLGNTALINGIGTSNMSLGAIVMFAALLFYWKKYVSDREGE